MKCKHLTVGLLDCNGVPDIELLIAEASTSQTAFLNKHIASYQIEKLPRQTPSEVFFVLEISGRLS